jgi:hypothetical protein
MLYSDRDWTDLGLVDLKEIDYFPLYESEVRRRRLAREMPRAPRPRPPAEDELNAHPASRPDLHAARIYQKMGWTKDPRKSRPCASCLARPGASCTSDTGRLLTDAHPGR